MKKSILFFLLIGMTLLNSCETQEIILNEQNNTTSIFNPAIVDYFNNLKLAIRNNKENTKKISALMQAIDYSSVKQYALKNTIKLVVVDLKNFSVFSEADQTKAIFFVLNNSIIRSNIVTIKNKLPFENPDQVIVSIFDKKENKDNYSGKIEFYNLFQNILLSDEFEKGVLTVNGIARIDAQKKLTAKCTAWYWVTTYFDGTQTKEYMYTTCDCEEQTYRGDCGGGGGSYSSNNNSAEPNYPDNPNDKDLYTYIDHDGEIVTRQYDIKSKSWKIVSIKLADVIVNNNPEKYSFLLFAWPQDQQKIVNNNLIYTYDGASGSWEGEPATNEAIAQAIEDQIDDSKLDPCLKGVLNKLKNTTVCDIAEILTKLGANKSLYNTTIKSEPAPSGLPAQTVWNSPYNYTIYISTDYAGKTKLFIAASMVHEMVHAYFMSLFDDYHNSNPQNLNAYNDFASLFNYYVTLKRPSSINSADVHHQQMATDYVDAIARSLQEYQTGIPVSISATPDQIYSDLAWGGLSDAPVFDAIYPVGNPNRQRILNRYQAEGKGSLVGQGSTQAQSPISQPCN